MADDLTAVLALYNLRAERVEAAGGTAGRTWRVAAGGREWFVRRRGGRTATVSRVIFDQGLRRHLAAHGFCATPAIDSRDGRPWVEVGEGMYEVYPWVDGQPLHPERLAAARRPIAEALARFHRLAAGYTAPCEPLVPQLTHYPEPVAPRRRFDDPGAFLEAIDQVADRWAAPGEREPLRRARARVEWLAEAYSDAVHEALPQGVIHGDYNACNLLLHPDGAVAGVFDFDWAWRETRVRDVGEGLFFFGATRPAATASGDIWSLTACPCFDHDGLLGFLKAYHAAAPLSDAELRAVPLGLLGRWVACRTEGVMKVPEERRVAFLLAAFERPFEWAAGAARLLQDAAEG